MSTVAFLIFLLLLGSTGIFYAADSAKMHAGWGYEICSAAPLFCAHPGWGIVASLVAGLLYFFALEFEQK